MMSGTVGKMSTSGTDKDKKRMQGLKIYDYKPVIFMI